MPLPKDSIKREAWIERQRETHLGRRSSSKTEFKKGQVPWNKGIKIDKEKYPNYGHQKPHSNKTKETFSKSRKGRIPWNKGKNGIYSKETLEKMRQASKNPSPETLRKILHRRIPTSLEEKFQAIINKYNLPYKFVGDGSFILGSYNPDFINVNSEKIAIEVYAKYHKIKNHKNIDEWKEERTEVFRKYGWKIIYFDETQINKDKILSKLS